MNVSTFSLHIATYENSVEAASKFVDGTKEDLKHVRKDKNINQIFGVLSCFIQNAFEFSRQQENDQPQVPEVEQYKASQRLLNPNQMDRVASNQNPGALIYQQLSDESMVGFL
uniref:Uncharacterized protein n=1 Tax=Panagrolaimus sp. PS1159 TaxID=55785 RepID=A0AC35F466_9BILA